MSTRSRHPSGDQIEDAVCRPELDPEEAARVRAHAASCERCRARLAEEEKMRRRLGLLRQDEPEVDVVQQVLDRIDAHDGKAST